MQIGFYRFLFQTIFCCVVMAFNRAPRHVWLPQGNKVRFVILLRGLFGTSGMLCFFYALTHMTISDATVLVFTNPVITSILGAVVRACFTSKF